MTDERLTRAPRQRRGIRSFPLDGEAVLYDVAHDAVHYLNATARFVWDRCDGRRNADDIATELACSLRPQPAPIPRDRLNADVTDALVHLAEHGLVTLHRREAG